MHNVEWVDGHRDCDPDALEEEEGCLLFQRKPQLNQIWLSCMGIGINP